MKPSNIPTQETPRPPNKCVATKGRSPPLERKRKSAKEIEREDGAEPSINCASRRLTKLHKEKNVEIRPTVDLERASE